MIGRRGVLLGAVLACASMAVGCKGSEVAGRVATRVTTAVAPDVVVAGGAAEVTCTIYGPKDRVVADDTTFAVTPTEGLGVEGTTLTPTVAGTYAVVCSAPRFDLTDPTGATLTVVPGPPVKVTTVLDRPTIAVFESSPVDCIVEDAYGNVVPDAATTVSADEGATVAGGSVGSSKVGSYEVRCGVDGAPEAEVVPATLTVTAADPATVELLADPTREVYLPDTQVRLYWVVRDAYGNEIADVPGTLEAPTQGVTKASGNDNRYFLNDEGIHTFRVTLDPPWELLTDDLDLIVDASGPEIVITWPERGATLSTDEADENGFIRVVGNVIDAYGEVSAFELNGEGVALEPDGSFEALVVPYWGVNILVAVAEDGWGNTSKLSPTFAYSSDYLPYEEQSAQGVKQDDGLELLVGQSFLDDGDHDPSNINDLATLLEVLLSDLDLAQILTDLAGGLDTEIPLFNPSFNLGGLVSASLEGKIVITVEAAQATDIGGTTVTLDSRVGGIDSAIEIGGPTEQAFFLGLEFGAALPITLSGQILGFGGSFQLFGSAKLFTTIEADSILLGSKIDLAKAPGGPLQVDIKQIDIDITNLLIDPIDDLEIAFGVNLPVIGPQTLTFLLSDLFDPSQLTDWILDPLTTQIGPLLVDLLEPLIETFADDILGGLLGALQLDIPIPLPDLGSLLGGGGGVDQVILDLYTELSSVVFTDDGGQIGLGLGLYADKGVERDPLGAIQRDGCLAGDNAAFLYDWASSFGLGVKTDAVNSGLFALWWSGWLDGGLDLGGLLGGGGGLPIPLDGVELQLQWLLPPIVNDCLGKGVVEAEIGDLYVYLTGNIIGIPVTAVLYVDASLALAFGATEEGLVVTVGDFGFFDVEVLEVTDALNDFIDLRDLLENNAKDLLGSFIVGQTFGPIALPAIDLSTLVPGLPASAVLELGNISVQKSKGYIVLGADLK